MGDYLLLVCYGPDEEPGVVRLRGVSAGDAETARQALVSQVEHAVSIEAPEIRPDQGELERGR